MRKFAIEIGLRPSRIKGGRNGGNMGDIRFHVSLARIAQEFSLETLYTPKDIQEILVHTIEVNRPGLQLQGFFGHFDPERIQVMGASEFAYLQQFSPERLEKCFDEFFGKKPPAVIIARELTPFPQMMEAAVKHGIPILTTDEPTSSFSSALVAFLSVELAPRITRHGVLVEVYGEGILLLGDSGVGKSETAIELVKRGHRLIADDAVEIRRVSKRTLVGSSPENIRHFLELRGVGIINVRRLFGMGAVKVTEKVDLIIKLEPWDQNKVYDRMGMEEEFSEILGLKVPSLTIPVKPGRNLAIIIEVAAMNNRQKKMGYNAAAELLEKLGMGDDVPNPGGTDWNTF